MKNLKKIAVVAIVVLTMMSLVMAHAETVDAAKKSTMVSLTTTGEIGGTWTLNLEANSKGLYPSVLDLGDGRSVVIPLTYDELRVLMEKALAEENQRVEAEKKAQNPDDRPWIAKAWDTVTFWN